MYYLHYFFINQTKALNKFQRLCAWKSQMGDKGKMPFKNGCEWHEEVLNEMGHLVDSMAE